MKPGTYNLETWEAFEEKLADLQSAYANSESIHKFLYRGQGHFEWNLQCTLERRSSNSQLTWAEYASLANATLPAVQSLTNRDWTAPSQAELLKWGSEFNHSRDAPPGYDYYVYLRHHGFPSPLLDWSRSPYVAAFFAFRHSSVDRVAIFVYRETGWGAKVTTRTSPQIIHFGPYVKSHPRHVLQQCEYTICSSFHNGAWSYAAYDEVFALGKTDQDLIWKFTLPATERLKVLKRLDTFNLNAHSLFPTEDALLETVALREIEFRERHPLITLGKP